ncbi:MAG: prephenate dehydrogenase/arogenate dehydrogenase family protein [Actinomycetota bacterium]
MPTAGIIGTGLIGGSVAVGLSGAGWDVIGFDADPDTLRTARERGLVDTSVDSVAGIVAAEPDVIVVAAPPKATIEILSNLDTGLVVMDVAGIKSDVVAAAGHLPKFVGTHPMAGRETSGPASASPALFKGANWIIVEGSPPEATEQVAGVVQALGANPVLMSAEAHDRVVAAVSHLPQLLAAGLLGSAAETEDALMLAAGSFRDLTRVAASQPLPWVEILKSNEAAVSAAIDALRDHLDRVEAAIAAPDDTLLSYLSRSRDVRRSLGAPVMPVRISLADEPGEIARVGQALAESHVDVRDIQIRHAPHGGGGVLTVSVRAGEEEALRHSLDDVGLTTLP